MARTWAEWVREGRAAMETITDRQWKLGDLAIEVAGPAHAVAENGDDKDGKLSKYADEIGVEYSTLAKYRQVATAFRLAARPVEIPVPWVCFREVYKENDRVELIRNFVANCVNEQKRPSYRLFQAFLGKRPTLEITKAHLREQVEEGLQRMPAEHAEAIVVQTIATRPELQEAIFTEIAKDPDAATKLLDAVHDRRMRERGSAVEMRPRSENPYTAYKLVLSLVTAMAQIKAQLGDNPSEIANLLRRADASEVARFQSDFAELFDFVSGIRDGLNNRRFEVMR